MARTKFKVEVLTPEGEVFNDEVEMVSTRTTVGSIGVLANHQPLLGHARARPSCACTSPSPTSSASPRARATSRSRGEQVLVLVEEAIRARTTSTPATCASAPRRAEESAREAEEGSEEEARCLRDKQARGGVPAASPRAGGRPTAPLARGPRADYPAGAVPIVSTGPVCSRRDCQRPDWKDGLCSRCWRLAHLFGKDPAMFAYEPLNGYRDARDTVALPWEGLEAQARARGVTVADLLAGGPAAD